MQDTSFEIYDGTYEIFDSAGALVGMLRAEHGRTLERWALSFRPYDGEPRAPVTVRWSPEADFEKWWADETLPYRAAWEVTKALPGDSPGDPPGDAAFVAAATFGSPDDGPLQHLSTVAGHDGIRPGRLIWEVVVRDFYRSIEAGPIRMQWQWSGQWGPGAEAPTTIGAFREWCEAQNLQVYRRSPRAS